MTLVYLLRHGSTTLNRETPYRLQGRTLDPELDAAGFDQASRAAELLARRPIAAVYSSPLRRARETAQAVAQSHRLPIVVEERLIEADLGRWEGLTWAEAEALDPDHFRSFMERPGTVPYPGGESFLDVQRRVDPIMARIAAAHEGHSIVVVGHNIVNRSYLAGVLGMPIDRARPIRQANGGINIVRFEGEAAHLETLNSTFHLDDPDAS